MARPSSLTPDAEEDILAGLEAGLGGQDAAEAAGIPASTWYGWLRLARAGDPRYVRLLTALTESRRRRRLARRNGVTTAQSFPPWMPWLREWRS